MAQVEPVVEEATGTPIRISSILWMSRGKGDACAAYWHRSGERQGRIEFYPSPPLPGEAERQRALAAFEQRTGIRGGRIVYTTCDDGDERLRTLVHELAHAVEDQRTGMPVAFSEVHGEKFRAIERKAWWAVRGKVVLPPWPMGGEE